MSARGHDGAMKGDGARERQRQEKPARPGSGKRLISRPAVAPGSLRTLKRLIYEAYVAAGAPTLDDMASAVAEDEQLRAVRPGTRSTGWSEMLRRSVSRRTSWRSSRCSRGWPEAMVRQAARQAATSWTQAQLSEPLGRPIDDIDPYDLEVHRSITVRGASGLPTYVERAHDIEMRRLLLPTPFRAPVDSFCWSVRPPRARPGASLEALRHLPRDWRLWHPIDPERPRAALDALDQVGPKTVVSARTKLTITCCIASTASPSLLVFARSWLIPRGLRSWSSALYGRAPATSTTCAPHPHRGSRTRMPKRVSFLPDESSMFRRPSPPPKLMNSRGRRTRGLQPLQAPPKTA